MSSNRTLKPEQAIAAHTIDRHVSVTAGPGAGKTTVLVERYLYILRQTKNISLDQIVAITFTTRAANEMRERLRTKLDELLAASEPEERRRLMRFKRTLDGAIITTIHGFCSHLLREYPVEAKLDPQFVQLDAHRAAMLLDAAVEETLTDLINAGHEPILRLTAGVGRGKLAAMLVDLYKAVRGQGVVLEELEEQTAANHACAEDYASVLAELEANMAEFLSLGRLTPAAEKKRAAAAEQWPELRRLIAEMPARENLSAYCRAINDFRKIRPTSSAVTKMSNVAFDNLLWGEASKSGQYFLGLLPQTCFDIYAGEFALEVIKALRAIDASYEETKQQLGALDYDDLQLRALRLLDEPGVPERAARRYKYFLVDEFQDTNRLQRDLMDRLALKNRRDANLFIVGDRKQSIYGFRGANVDVFREMSEALERVGGMPQPLHLNFRSQPPLINFFNLLFARLFEAGDVHPDHLGQLGFVEHEHSIAEREGSDEAPLVELLVDTVSTDLKLQQSSRERDAAQLTARIISLVGSGPSSNEPPGGKDSGGSETFARKFQYRDIALLFRAMTNVPEYETAFRRANIPYQTVSGKGFYGRQEIMDIIQMLRFLDNSTDELALAAVLRSPLCGVSDNALLALRLAPAVGDTRNEPRLSSHPRKLLTAVFNHSEIDFVADDDRAALDRASNFLTSLLSRRNRCGIYDLLRFAVDTSEYATVVAASFDGAQRLANLQKLFTLAERFERSGTYLIRDFVQYVHDFEAMGSRESEGQLDDSADAVTLMTIHQAKGLEFPVVIIPDLHRTLGGRDQWFLLDRHMGLTMRVPNGRGEQVAGRSFKNFSERAKQREHFESMRLMYVAATRAKDRLIFSGATEGLEKLSGGRDTWLKWIWHALELAERAAPGAIDLGSDAHLQLTVDLVDSASGARSLQPPATEIAFEDEAALIDEPARAFPLLHPVAPELEHAVHRFSVTSLVNYQRCPRQYYFDRLLHLPTSDEMSRWNEAEAPETPGSLTATMKGSVIHRFCEIYRQGDDPAEMLRVSFRDLEQKRPADFAERLREIDREKAVKELLPLAENYVASSVFARVEAVRQGSTEVFDRVPFDRAGLWSELSFRIRRPRGILTGTIDKLLVSATDDGFDLEIIDFKTNRLRAARKKSKAVSTVSANDPAMDLFGGGADEDEEAALLEEVRAAAGAYQLQMQAYALAVRELVPEIAATGNIKVTIHFLESNSEFSLSEELLGVEECERALDAAIDELISADGPRGFPVRPAQHCRACSFRPHCPAGLEWVALN
jgi:ATP-dependent helicase/nuclease subunit A